MCEYLLHLNGHGRKSAGGGGDEDVILFILPLFGVGDGLYTIFIPHTF